MGARGGSVIYTNKRAPAQHSTEQGRLREDSAGPVHAERPPVGQRTAPAHTTGSRRQALTSLVAAKSKCRFRNVERAAPQSAGLGGPRGKRRPRRCFFFFSHSGIGASQMPRAWLNDKMAGAP
ncbi:hypothetical protein NDU88_004439 [Pleurodeles waltl]|uniref:Uncharacterized protein n=1 Tax=Pleurodeles waltl TaxID=8319 RepID=A0AAV7TRZ3_PLEWA|nr:hypothetical protein NDU88_004439 [Pleurodeles waltl]